MANRKNDTTVNGLTSNKALILPLVIVLVSCIYPFIQNPPQPFGLLLVAAFCCLALYLILTKRSIGKFAVTCTVIFTVVALLFIVAALPGMDRPCEGLICALTSTFPLHVIFFNPFVSPLWIALSITGIILLARRLK